MAKRRMLSLDVVDTDNFVEMPVSSQNLYFHLAVRADDDGFVSSPNKIQKMVGANKNDFEVLLAKKFVIPFKSGVCVITHWRLHNYIQSDRYHETIYKEEKALLSQDNNNVYKLDTKCIQDVSKVDTEVRLGKVRIGKVNITNANALRAKPEVSKKEKKSRRTDIDLLLKGIDQITGGLDGSKKINRQYAKNFLDSKIHKVFELAGKKESTEAQRVQGVLRIFQLAKESQFHSQHIRKMKYIYNNALTIIDNKIKKQTNDQPIKNY